MPVTGRWPARTVNNRLSNASCLLGISKWASPIGDLVACRSEVWEVRGLNPHLVNVKEKEIAANISRSQMAQSTGLTKSS